MRIANKLESMMIWADDVWGMGEPVGEHVVDALEKAQMIITSTPEEYAENEFGKDEPEYQEYLEQNEFSTISVWTMQGYEKLRLLRGEQRNGKLRIPSKYEDFS